MASRSTVPVQNLISCAICLEHFDDPRLLPCSHTFCLRCIRDMASANKGQFECPLRDGTKINQNCIDSLPLNRIVRDIVELLGPIQCSNCHSNTAVYWCDKCGNSYCSECSTTVHAPRALQNHRVVAMSEKLPEIASCQTHTDEKLRYWCHACDILVCRDCLLFEHKEHKYALMDQVARTLKSQIETDLQSIQLSLTNRVDQANILISKIVYAAKCNKTQVVEAMASLRRTIDEHEQTVLDQILEMEVDQKKQIHEYQSRLQNEQNSLDIQKSNFTIINAVKDNTKLLQAKQGFIDYTQRINEVLNGLQPPTLPDYCIKGLYQLQGLQEKLRQCAQFVQSSTHSNPQLEMQIVNSQANTTLILDKQGLTDQDMDIVANTLRKTNTLVELSLCHNQIGHIGAKYLADFLSENQTLTSLNLYANQIGDHGAQYMADALRNNQTLAKLYLNENEIGDHGMQYLADALGENQTLIKLDLYNNQISHIGAQHLANALRNNKTLTVLSLHSNRIGNQGAQYIADALRNNQALTALDLDKNQIDEQGAKYLADALKENNTLTKLHINRN